MSSVPLPPERLARVRMARLLRVVIEYLLGTMTAVEAIDAAAEVLVLGNTEIQVDALWAFSANTAPLP